MSGFLDFVEDVAPEPKRLPINGKLYEFPARVSAETGRLLLLVWRTGREGGDVEGALRRAAVDDEHALDMQDELLGEAFDELVMDGRSGAIPRVMTTLTTWHLFGQAAAEQVWNAAADPQTAPNRQARRGGATSTRAPGSTAGTPKAKPKKASRGSGSATTGR